ncbi:hypothetical protein JAAARDRAFT_212021 [Jaapia argillacea MUCL 33604]|uniref:Integral membrane protein n=1 Tax=Jaapia argillacea MUCL 33604 TaxID=933084 RepID=A0A067PH64_9AGAM|nr:hypothetical protein JAAARDRAFT_212021 [Jaapia argillacea MUCL 33604]
MGWFRSYRVLDTYKSSSPFHVIKLITTMGLNTEARAALVFLILYAILFFILDFAYLTRRLRLRSRYTVILFHVTVRLASQATGLAFGVVGYNNIKLLVAYFILGAEGYFTLVLCAYRFLISWQVHNLACHNSWLEPLHAPGTPTYRKFLDSFKLFGPRRRPMAVIHNLLIVANTIIIVGGSLITGGAQNSTQFKNLPQAKGMRTAGQAIFLSMSIFLLYCIYDTIQQSKQERKSYNAHPTLYILLAAWPCLFIRGVYGILAPTVPIFNYFDFSNYGPNGLIDGFVISEYIMGTSMEWTACLLLMVTYITSRNDPKKADFADVQYPDELTVEKDESGRVESGIRRK